MIDVDTSSSIAKLKEDLINSAKERWHNSESLYISTLKEMKSLTGAPKAEKEKLARKLLKMYQLSTVEKDADKKKIAIICAGETADDDEAVEDYDMQDLTLVRVMMRGVNTNAVPTMARKSVRTYHIFRRIRDMRQDHNIKSCLEKAVEPMASKAGDQVKVTDAPKPK